MEKLDIDGLNYSFKYHLKDEFPVVNISKEGAKLYCKWLTEQLIKEQKMNLDCQQKMNGFMQQKVD
jgi:hypothetical protein